MSPKKQSTAGKKARSAARQGEKYTTALRREAADDVSPAELNALGVAAAKAYADSFADKDDWDWDTRQARAAWREVQWWERMRAGRDLRIWEAVIETRAAALDADDAWQRLSLYLRKPLHRGADKPGLHMTWDIEDSSGPQEDHRRELAPLSVAELAEGERERLDADYPRTVFRHRTVRGEHYGAWEQAHLQDYVEALLRAADRLSGPGGEDVQRWAAQVEAERGPLPDGVTLTYWRAHHRVTFLAGYDRESAQARAEEIAATVVDCAGRALGRVIEVRPDDGFRNARDGRWMHPAASAIGELERRQLWEDYEQVEVRAAVGEPVGSRSVLAGILRAGAAYLREQFDRHTGEYDAHEARLHTQPDGRRTYATVAQLRHVTEAAVREAAGKSPAELREMAEKARYLARRVYGKVVEGAEDVIRIEASEQHAHVWDELATAGEAAAKSAASELLRPPATVIFDNGIVLTVYGGELRRPADQWHGGADHEEFSGHIDRDRGALPWPTASVRILLPGQGAYAVTDAHIDISNYGGRRDFLRLTWCAEAGTALTQDTQEVER